VLDADFVGFDAALMSLLGTRARLGRATPLNGHSSVVWRSASRPVRCRDVCQAADIIGVLIDRGNYGSDPFGLLPSFCGHEFHGFRERLAPLGESFESFVYGHRWFLAVERSRVSAPFLHYAAAGIMQLLQGAAGGAGRTIKDCPSSHHRP